MEAEPVTLAPQRDVARDEWIARRRCIEREIECGDRQEGGCGHHRAGDISSTPRDRQPDEGERCTDGNRVPRSRQKNGAQRSRGDRAPPYSILAFPPCKGVNEQRHEE